MKLKNVCLITTAIIATNMVSAHANLSVEPYFGLVGGYGGATMYIDDDADTKHSHSAQSYGAVLGVDIPILRIDAEYNYLHQKNSHQNIVMANVYAKMPTLFVKPYVGAGIGAMFDISFDNVDKHIDSTVAYQGMVGLTLDIPVLPVDIDIEGRALYAPDLFKIADDNVDMFQYEGRIKLRYMF